MTERLDLPAWFLEQAGGWPRRYVAFDTETTGLAADRDVVVEIGWVRVVDGHVVDSGQRQLNWLLRPDAIPADEFRARYEAVTASLADRGETYPLTWEEITSGEDPLTVLAEWTDRVARDYADGWAYIGHNVYRFDEPMLAASSRRLHLTYPLAGPWSLWDTQALAIARRLPPRHPLRQIDRQHTLRTWSLAVLRDAPAALRVGTRLRHLAGPEASHRAAADAHACHRVFASFVAAESSS